MAGSNPSRIECCLPRITDARAGLFIDANLLVLLVVGSVDRGLIEKYRRLREYSEEDYDLPLGLLGRFQQVFVTPNTLTETSDLLGQHAEPERSLLFKGLRFIIQRSREVVVASKDAASNREFERLGRPMRPSWKLPMRRRRF